MTSDPGETAFSGPIHLFPMDVTEKMNGGSLFFFGPSPWGVPLGMGMIGERAADGEDVLTTIFESPQEQFHAPTQISKEQMEQLQLERLRTDYRLRGVELPWSSVQRGPDQNKPPDFVASVPDGKLGVDFTRLSITERMTAQALLRRLRRAILDEPREAFAHLTGAIVYLWFNQAGFSSLPPKQNNAVEALLKALREYVFDPQLTVLQTEDGKLPELGDIGNAESGKGAHFYAVPMTNGTPSSFFYQTTGFELGLAFQTVHDVSAAWSSITRLIDSHDNPDTQILVITAGAPDRNGLSYPSETALMNFALERQGPDLNPKYLQQVYIHSWTEGAVTRIYPVLHCIAPPLYQGGFTPAHFSIVPLAMQTSLRIVGSESEDPPSNTAA